MIEKRGNINLRFMENIARFVVIFLAVQWVVMSSSITQSFGRVLFQGTTVVAAIAGFAAQPVIADMICGLMISATKPFNIGDRIELEDGAAGVVIDITLRHVTLRNIDAVVVVVPNRESDWTIPGKPGRNGAEYGPVYFIQYADLCQSGYERNREMTLLSTSLLFQCRDRHAKGLGRWLRRSNHEAE